MLKEALPIGQLRLRVGVRYSVISPFVDDNAQLHPDGEVWTYLGYERPKMFPGYVIHVQMPGKLPTSFRLKWGSDGQAEVMQKLQDHIRAPIAPIDQAIALLSVKGRDALTRANGTVDKGVMNADDVLRSIREKAGAAACADGRSGVPNPYHDPANDLATLVTELEDAITKVLQDPCQHKP